MREFSNRTFFSSINSVAGKPSRPCSPITVNLIQTLSLNCNRIILSFNSLWHQSLSYCLAPGIFWSPGSLPWPLYMYKKPWFVPCERVSIKLMLLWSKLRRYATRTRRNSTEWSLLGQLTAKVHHCLKRTVDWLILRHSYKSDETVLITPQDAN